MSYLPATKFGNCSVCPSTNCACIKVGKNLFCVPCHRKNKGQQQIQRATERDKQRRQATSSTQQNQSCKVRSLISSIKNKEVVGDNIVKGIAGSKSELLREADRVFSLWVRNRDSDKDGNIICPCCHKKYNVAQLDNEGNKLVQCLHFVSRNVYSLRHDPDNAKSGCGYCNLAMHLQPKGKEYLSYKEVLVKEFGEAAVLEMELAHRKINRIDASQLKNVIEFYS